jgi:hypothetical protein
LFSVITAAVERGGGRPTREIFVGGDFRLLLLFAAAAKGGDLKILEGFGAGCLAEFICT